MSEHPLATEFPLGSPVYDLGNTKLYVIGWLDDDPGSLWASPVKLEDDADLSWKRRAGIPAAHARHFREHFTERKSA